MSESEEVDPLVEQRKRHAQWTLVAPEYLLDMARGKVQEPIALPSAAPDEADRLERGIRDLADAASHDVESVFAGWIEQDRNERLFSFLKSATVRPRPGAGGAVASDLFSPTLQKLQTAGGALKMPDSVDPIVLLLALIRIADLVQAAGGH